MKGKGRGTLVALSLAVLGLVAGPRPASAQEKKPNIVFIMGDDIGWMQPSIYHRGLMVGKRRTSIASATKARSSWLIMPSRAAPPGAMPSSPACIRFALA